MAETTGAVKIRVTTDTKEIQAMQKQLKAYEEEIRQINSKSESSGNSARQAAEKTEQATELTTRMLQKQNSTMTTTQAQYNTLQRKAQRLAEEMEQVGKVKAPTEEYAALKDELTKVQEEMQRLEESKMGIEVGAYADEANAQLEQLRATSEALTEQLRQMEEAGTDSTEKIADPAKYQKLQDELAKTTDQMAALQNKMNQTGESSTGAANTFSKAATSFARSSNSANGALSTMNGALSTTAGTVGLVAGVIVMAAKSIADAIQDCYEVGKEFLEEIGSTAADIAKSAMTSAISSIEDAAEKAEKAISSLASAISSMINDIMSSGITALLDAFNTQLELTQEASILAGDCINQLESDLADIGNALVSAFTPLIEVVIPYINMFTEALAEAINMLGMLIASLTGKTSYTKLVAISEDLDEVSDSAEEAENNLAAFDELDVLSDDDTYSYSSAGSGLSYMTEEIPIDSWAEGIEDLFDLLEELDAFDFGYSLADKLANWLNDIPWEEIQEKAATLGMKLAEFLNGIFSNLDLATALGHTIAQAINTALIFAYNFIKTFDFYQFGVWIATALNQAVQEIDWELLGTVIAEGINGLVDAIKGFIETTDWYALFYSIGTAIYTALTGIDWVNIADTILAGIDAITQAIWGWVDSIDWVDIAAQLIEGINYLVEGQYIDENGQVHDIWEENGEAVAALINDFIDGVVEFVTTFPYIELAEAILTWLKAAIGGIEWEDIATSINSLVNGLLDMIDTALSDDEAKQVLIDAIGALVDGIEIRDIGNKLIEVIRGVTDYLLEVGDESGAWEAIGELWMTSVQLGWELKWAEWKVKWKVFSTEMGSLFDDWATTYSEQQLEQANLEYEMTQAQMELIGGLFSSAGDAILEGQAATQAAQMETDQAMAEATSELISNCLDSISNFFTNAWDSICTTVSNAWDSIYTGLTEGLEAISNFFTTIWNSICTTVSSAWDAICTGLTEGLNTLSEAWDETWTALQDTVKGIINGIIGFINTLISGIETMVNALVTAINSISIDLPDLVGGGHIGFDLNEVSLPRVPELADGAVIRGGDPFAAILGDQNSGQTNIETPLSTMVEAFKTALEEEGYGSSGINTVSLELDGKTLAEASLDYFTSAMNRRGVSAQTTLQGV